jgi:hypothetical protein
MLEVFTSPLSYIKDDANMEFQNSRILNV